MPLVTANNGLLQIASASLPPPADRRRRLATGFPAIDDLLPRGALAAGAVHEVLGNTDFSPALWPVLLARAAAKLGWVVWCDPARRFYPPAAAALGLPLERLLVLRAASVAEELWALAECLRCAGVGACVAAVGRLSLVQVRRLQLAAEKGGGVGILLRPAEAIRWPYAAATRWRVMPVPGERTLQRCYLELIHGHGGRVGGGVLLEVCRETNHVRAVETMAHRQVAASPAVAGA
jgi:hypothetical protein